MLSSIKYEKIAHIFFFKRLPEVLHFSLSIIFVLCRYFMAYESLGYLNWGFLVSILICTYVLIFFKKVKKKMASNFYFIYVFTTCNYLLIAYLTFDANFLFFSGMETMIAIYFNFQKISNKILRLTFLGVFAIGFLRKTEDFKFDAAKIAYLIYIMFIFEVSMKFNSTKKIDQAKKTNSISDSKRFHQDDSSAKSPSINQNELIEIPIDFNPSQKLLNLIRVGIVLVNQDFKIIYSNNILSELFENKTTEEARSQFFALEEKVEINNNNDFSKIPHLSFQEIFKKKMHFFPGTNETIQIFESSEQTLRKSNKIITEESIILQKQNAESFTFKEDIDSQFKNWKRRKLSDPISGNIFDTDKRKEQAQSVHSYLKKLFEYFKQEGQLPNMHIHGDTSKKSEKKKYYMYANYKSSEDAKDLIILINFIRIKENINPNSTHEILITVRKLSDLEVKFIEESKSKNKMLGSFCHELRTPINGIINMLDLIETQNEETKTVFEHIDKGFEELLSSAVINSHLLLNEIDDFIDYFSFCNEIIEAHMSPFDFQEFFNEINRVFSFMAKKKGLSFFIEIEKTIPLIVYNDQQRLRQILYNLLSNFLYLISYLLLTR